MNPTRGSHATLVDLLDRALDKGLILDADIIIDVAGVPLLGLKLRAALAGMETMLEYGIWQDWDEARRAAAAEDAWRKAPNPDGTRVSPDRATPIRSNLQPEADGLATH